MYLKAILSAPHPPALIPEVGKGRELLAEKTLRGLKDLALSVAKIAPQTIVCITPHGNVFQDGVSVLYDPVLRGDFSAFGTEEAQMEKHCDMGLLDELRLRLSDHDCSVLFINPKIAAENDLSMALDHGVMVPLYFIDKVYPDYRIIHITVGGLSLVEHYRIGRVIREAVEVNGKDTVILACADLSHALSDRGPYDYHPQGEVFDQTIRQSIENKSYYNILTMPPAVSEPAAECGLRPLITALGAADSINTEAKVLSYEAPFGVGYMTAMITFDLSGDDPTNASLLKRYAHENEQAYARRLSDAHPVARLAIEAIECWVKGGKALNIEEYLNHLEDQNAKSILQTSAGVFVTIEKAGELRGCMGTVQPVMPCAADEIVRNAIEAAAYDPRFIPVEAAELHQLTVSVSILDEAEAVENPADLSPEKYGLIGEQGVYRGVLLPGLPGIETPQQQIEAVRRKAGIPEYMTESDDDPLRLYRFGVRMFK